MIDSAGRMTPRPLSRAEVRAIDAEAAEEYGLPTLILMENAGRGAADRLMERLSPADEGSPKVLILCGAGNNGGDGSVMARHLDLQGVAVKIVIFVDPQTLKGDASTQWSIVRKSGIDCEVRSTVEGLAESIAEADWVVDGLLGTGLTRPVEGLLAEVISLLNRSETPVLALDIPSGLDCDTGLPLGIAVRAKATVTFFAPKIGFASASGYVGEVQVVDIGAPRALLKRYC